jgi:hypothetical protein
LNPGGVWADAVMKLILRGSNTTASNMTIKKRQIDLDLDKILYDLHIGYNVKNP